jgi:hypothetical protein
MARDPATACAVLSSLFPNCGFPGYRAHANPSLHAELKEIVIGGMSGQSQKCRFELSVGVSGRPRGADIFDAARFFSNVPIVLQKSLEDRRRA